VGGADVIGRGLVVAASFLTRVPGLHRRDPDVAAATPWFPVVGALVGGVVGAVGWGVARTTSPLLGGVVAVVAGLLVTGAFHEDGLGDVADAFVGGWTPEDRLRILGDSRHGTYGVAAICGSILVRAVALGSLAPGDVLRAAVLAHALGRAGALVAMLVGRPAAATGLGADYIRRLPRPRVLVALAVVGGATVALDPLRGALMVASVVGVGVAMSAWARRKVGGVTGDALGATEQLGEIAVLLVAVATT
jgi:adenosylcobinamide-GDP ribazoletransferase